MKIVIPDDYQNAVPAPDCYELLRDFDVTLYQDACDEPETLAERFSEADALVLNRVRKRRRVFCRTDRCGDQPRSAY